MQQSDGLIATVASGDYRASLEALRDDLAVSVQAARDAGELRTVAPLAKQLTDVLATLDSLPNVERASTSDELRARRKARRAAASAS